MLAFAIRQLVDDRRELRHGFFGSMRQDECGAELVRRPEAELVIGLGQSRGGTARSPAQACRP
jgi:hypothetical protein